MDEGSARARGAEPVQWRGRGIEHEPALARQADHHRVEDVGRRLLHGAAPVADEVVVRLAGQVVDGRAGSSRRSPTNSR